MDERIESSELALVRKNVYIFFSEFFGNGRTELLLSHWNDIKTAIALLADASLPDEPEELKSGNELEAAYAKLFYGVGERTIPLSESSYRNELSMTCQQTTQDLLALYAQNGFLLPGREQEADTLSVELAFAAKLCGKDEKALSRLLADHLKPLALCVYDAVSKQDNSKLISGVCSCLYEFVRVESESIT